MNLRYILLGLMFLFGAAIPSACAHTFKPQTDKELIQTSVTIKNMAENSGGSGVIYKSTKTGSFILTNKHVCEVVKDGGVVESLDHIKHTIMGMREDAAHDLCLIKVAFNYHMNIKIAKDSPEVGDEAIVVGHPSLLPVLVTRGMFSEHMMVDIMEGARDCTEAEKGEPTCIMYGKMPVIVHRDSVVISATIMAGSSGSPVFNSKGELSGLVFAGMQGLSYGLIVPLEYLRAFLL